MKWSSVLFGCALAGCASGGELEGGAPSGGSTGVTQAGAQDAAHFRKLIEDGAVPEPSILDQVGFFAEHALDQPPADCGEVVCAHPSLAVAPDFDDGTWTMAFVSLNSPVDPETRPRQPVHLVLAVESSQAARALTGDGTELVDQLLATLEPEDRLSVVSFAEEPRLLLAAAVPGEATASIELPTPEPDGHVDLYAGIASASDALGSTPDFTGKARIVLLTTGRADAGITDAVRIEGLAAALVREGTPFSVVGMGEDYRSTLPHGIAELGAGNYAFAENQGDLEQLVTQEAGVRLVPLASDVELRVVPSAGYRVGRVYGARRAVVEDGAAVLRSPALFLGTRSSAGDAGEGRRGGGGGLFVELVVDADAASGIPAEEPAFRLETSYTDVDAGAKVSFETAVSNSLPPGQRPAENWPEFSAPEYGKAFMMLNMYLALKAMVDLYSTGDCGSALGVSYMMEPGVEEWDARFEDPDIAADGATMLLLRQNISDQCRATPVPPTNYEAGCFGI